MHFTDNASDKVDDCRYSWAYQIHRSINTLTASKHQEQGPEEATLGDTTAIRRE